jgi:hypothetical protein
MPKHKIGFDVSKKDEISCPVCHQVVKVSGVCNKCVESIENTIRAEFNLPKEI